MRHFVLTRSAYGPTWDVEANRRRLAVTRAVTARLMAAQTSRDWSWIVALDPLDPLLEERKAVFADAAPEFVPMMWNHPDQMGNVPWDPEPKRNVSVNELIAAAAYRADWRSLMGPGPVLQTRLDDDDGLRPDALARYQQTAQRLRTRSVLMFPNGVRAFDGRYADITHRRNAMHSLFTPAGDDLCIYAYGHTRCNTVAPVLMLDRKWAWIWVRHRDTISGWRATEAPLDKRVRNAFPLDWPALEAAWS